MKTIRNIIIALVILMGLSYFGQVQKAVRVKQVRLKWQLEEGKITQEKYNKEIQNVSFGKMLMNPKYVLEVD